MSEVWIPHDYQLGAVKFFIEHAHAGLFLDPGMGKTSVSLTAADVFLKRQDVRRILIIAPIRPMYKVWPDEILKWEHTRHLSYTILHGDNKDFRLNEIRDIYLINPEGLKWLMQNGGPARLGVDMLILDESTKFKDSSTARFKLIKPILHYFKRRYILTGNPNPNGYGDLFGQMYVCDRGEALGQYVTHFRNNYFVPLAQSGHVVYSWGLQPGAAERIHERLRPKVMRLDAEDHLEMPELITNDIIVDLPPDVMKTYRQMENDFLVELGDATILSANAAALGVKLRQIANGGLYDEFHVAHHLHDAKTAALVDLVEQLQGQPLLLAYEFKHDLDRILRVFPDAPNLTGATGIKLDLMIDEFNDGRVPLQLAHPAAAGHGLNLQENCHNVGFYGLTWDLDLYNQFFRRVWRQGNKSKYVMLHRILADKTRDKQAAKALLNKELTSKQLNQALKERE